MTLPTNHSTGHLALRVQLNNSPGYFVFVFWLRSSDLAVWKLPGSGSKFRLVNHIHGKPIQLFRDVAWGIRAYEAMLSVKSFLRVSDLCYLPALSTFSWWVLNLYFQFLSPRQTTWISVFLLTAIFPMCLVMISSYYFLHKESCVTPKSDIKVRLA